MKIKNINKKSKEHYFSNATLHILGNILTWVLIKKDILPVPFTMIDSTVGSFIESALKDINDELTKRGFSKCLLIMKKNKKKEPCFSNNTLHMISGVVARVLIYKDVIPDKYKIDPEIVPYVDSALKEVNDELTRRGLINWKLVKKGEYPT